jgi:hypothetical protein
VRYYKAIIEGVLKIKNFKNKAITLEIRNKIQGQLKETSHPWKILWQKIHFSPNEDNFVQWTLHLKKGEEKIIKYKFEVYVNR